MEATKRTRSRQKPDGTLSVVFKPQFWTEADSRLAIVRQIKQRHSQLIQDTGADSFQQIALAERASFLLVWLESTEIEAVKAGRFDSIGNYIQGLNSLQGILKTLGLKKYARKITDLRSYIASKERE